MKPGGQRQIAGIFTAVISFSVFTTAWAEPSSLSSSKTVSASQSAVTDTGTIIPLVAMNDVPISTAVENFCRQADINFIIDPRLIDWWNRTDDFGRELHNEPVVSIHFTNITALAALRRILEEHHLVLADDPQTCVARVTYPDQIVAPADPALLARNTNIVPLIRFEDVPITTALENLAQQIPVNYILDPQLSYGMPDKNWNTKPEPDVNLSWQNITAAQAMVALCKNYGLAIIRDPATGVFFIRTQNHGVNFLDPSSLGSDTNIVPLFEFRDVPLTVGMENLAKQTQVHCLVDFRGGNNEPVLNFRWERMTPRQAVIAVCENYDLTIVWDESTKSFQIKSR
jgi:hypothetical protein